VSERESWPGSDGPDLDESMEDVRAVLGEEREDEPDELSEEAPEDGPEDTPIPQLRGAGVHAEGELRIPPHVKVLEGTPNGSRPEVQGPTTTVVYPDGVHILNNVWFKARPMVGDWLAETL